MFTFGVKVGRWFGGAKGVAAPSVGWSKPGEKPG